ncbi:HNH endonuclease signature motif containing protein [Cellulomonas sp. URHD0024]|uniref:HNH endonuclease signature motif containing protein n=1 Tax=Cellulomonas sp. URHD0024 TaxID=1302620 RepID=UPI0018CBD958|nr:HNH endonuclease signature motif containing protein [Cellulomonas sp. URHD0024]
MPLDAVGPGQGLPQFPVAGVSILELAVALDGVEVADLSSGDVIGVVQGFEQLIRAAQAAQAVAVRELEVRRPVHPSPVPDELACALVTTRRAAEMLLVRASLAAAHPAVHDAWAAGLLDARKVDILFTEALTTHAVDPREPTAGAADAALAIGLAAAPRMTGPQLARHVRAAVIACDPDAAEKRRTAARADRGVSLSPSVDGMAWLNAYLPAPDAVMAFTVLDALAGTTRVDGDERTADQRRADAFSDVFSSILTNQATPDGVPLPRRHGMAVSVGVTVAATTLLGSDDQPGSLDSFGPITAGMARELAQDGTWRRLLTDPATGLVCETGTVSYRPGADLTRTIIARDVTCTFPGCRQPAGRCDLDHIDPFDPARSADGQTCPDNLHALCRHHHEAKTRKYWNVHRDRATGITWWTSSDGLTYSRDPTPHLLDIAGLTTHAPPRSDDEPPPF